jgi:uncharacterized damage-inducible protein DinB
MSTATSESPLIAAIIEGWKIYQDQLVKIVEGLSPEQLATRIGPDLRTIGATIAHVVGGRAFWFAEVLKEGDAEVLVLALWDNKGQPLLTAAEYARGLRATWQLMANAIARWTEADLSESIVLPWIGPAHPVNRSFVVWHELEHDLHHGGEITHALGTLGLLIHLPPPPPED